MSSQYVPEKFYEKIAKKIFLFSAGLKYIMREKINKEKI